jgi:hypothetical protein
MTLLTFTGQRNGARVQMVWHDATLSGDLEAHPPDLLADEEFQPSRLRIGVPRLQRRGEDAVDRGLAHSASAHSKVSFALRPSPSVMVMA